MSKYMIKPVLKKINSIVAFNFMATVNSFASASLCILLISAFTIQTAVATEVSNNTSSKATATKSHSEPRVIILLGAPGSGKGTQAVKIAKQLHIPHISTGDIFRENVKNQTKLGKEAKGYMDAGKLVPDSLVTELVKDRLSKPDTAEGYILDGYPRTLEQAKSLDKLLASKSKNESGNKSKIIVIYLDVSDKVLLERIAQRAKETKSKRSDDTPEVAKTRLKTYHEETAPLINYYKERGELVNVNGEQGVEKTNKAILKAVE